MYAAKLGNLEIVQELIEAGADLDLHDARELPWHLTALMYACEAGQVDVVQQLIQAGATLDLSARPGKPGRTALMYAVDGNHVAIVKLLIEAGSDVTLTDRKNKSALDYGYSNTEIVKLLVAAGTDPYDVMSDYDSAIVSATTIECYDNVKLMLKSKCVRTDKPQVQKVESETLRKAVFSLDKAPDLDLIRELIEAGADVNDPDREGRTALMNAALCGHMDAVKLLLEAGADPSLKNHEGKNARSAALLYRHLEIARLLREKVSEQSQRDDPES